MDGRDVGTPRVDEQFARIRQCHRQTAGIVVNDDCTHAALLAAGLDQPRRNNIHVGRCIGRCQYDAPTNSRQTNSNRWGLDHV
jgi:hypothetical protein